MLSGMWDCLTLWGSLYRWYSQLSNWLNQKSATSTSCMHTHTLLAPLFWGSSTCCACSEWSKQQWAATWNHCSAQGRNTGPTLPGRRTLLIAWTWLPLLPVSIGARTNRVDLAESPPRPLILLAYPILLLAATRGSSCFGQASLFSFLNVLRW